MHPFSSCLWRAWGVSPRISRPGSSLHHGADAPRSPDPRLLLFLVRVREGDANVGVAALDRIRGPAGARHVAFHDRSAVDARLDDDQVLDAAFPAILGVAQRALEDGLEEAGRP